LTGQSTSASITPRAGAGAAVTALEGASRARLFRGTRPLKRWRYVAVFSERFSACAALVQVGPARQSFWAMHLRGPRELRERTRLLPRQREVHLAPGRVRVRDLGVELELALEEDEGIRALCAHARGEVFTRKQAGVRAHGTLALDGGPPRALEALAVIDDTCGYHARVTEWCWSAGVGFAPDGTPLAWNLVSGVNDPPSGSERAVWVAGAPSEPPPVAFAADLSSLRCCDGSELRFSVEAQRARHENLLVLRSDYRAPFGSFSGTLPGGVALERGRGVMEHHRARW
jgi:Domain of unknown function (DUF2804), C-terminal